jgi:hypothetical protein
MKYTLARVAKAREISEKYPSVYRRRIRYSKRARARARLHILFGDKFGGTSRPFAFWRERDCARTRFSRNTLPVDLSFLPASHAFLPRETRNDKARTAPFHVAAMAGKFSWASDRALPRGRIDASRFMRLIRTERSDSTRKRS